MYKDEKENRGVLNLFITYLLWTIIIIGAIFGYVYQSIKVADMEFLIKRMNRRVMELENVHSKLMTERVYLSSPERIGRLAENKLGLVPVSDKDIIWIKVDNSKKIAKLEKRE